MRSVVARVLIVLTLFALILGAGSVVRAEDYPPIAPSGPSAADCSEVAEPDITVLATRIRVVFGSGASLCVANVLVQVNPVLYNGPLPATGVLDLAIPEEFRNQGGASVSVTLFSGKMSISTALWAPVDGPESSSAGVAPDGSAAGSAQALAFTGSTFSLPLAVAAVLIGVGGLVLLSAHKRELAMAQSAGR